MGVQRGKGRGWERGEAKSKKANKARIAWGATLPVLLTPVTFADYFFTLPTASTGE